MNVMRLLGETVDFLWWRSEHLLTYSVSPPAPCALLEELTPVALLLRLQRLCMACLWKGWVTHWRPIT